MRYGDLIVDKIYKVKPDGYRPAKARLVAKAANVSQFELLQPSRVGWSYELKPVGTAIKVKNVHVLAGWTPEDQERLDGELAEQRRKEVIDVQLQAIGFKPDTDSWKSDGDYRWLGESLAFSPDATDFLLKKVGT
jgi:hypothetical protein